jgi:hypothetical protein
MGSLALAGIRTRQLPAELQRDPVNVVLGALFALGASATLFLLAHRALRWVAGWLEGDALRSRVASALTSFATAALALALAAAIVAALPGAERFDPRLARLAVFLVVLVIPFTGGWLFDLGRRLEGARAEALASARAWDREHYRILRDLGRRTAALEEEERRLAEVEAQRAAVLERLRTLQRRAAAAERLAADAAGEEGQELARLAQAVGTALELDRYRYLRLACARGQPMPGPEATTAPAGPPPLRAGREVAEPKLGLAG